jgi:hypothetical protein
MKFEEKISKLGKAMVPVPDSALVVSSAPASAFIVPSLNTITIF